MIICTATCTLHAKVIVTSTILILEWGAMEEQGRTNELGCVI